MRISSLVAFATVTTLVLVKAPDAHAASLEAVTSFGTNAAGLQMFRYVPDGIPANAPLVVALHGCTQTAADFEGIGLNALADEYKFYVVYAQQTSTNNSEECFNWFGQFNNPSNKANITRGQGENESIKEMVDAMKSTYSVDGSRVYVIGFSAGAAMAAVMLAAWPDVFSAGAIDAGIPYDCPSTSNTDVFMCMNPGKTETAAQWASFVTAADSGYTGKYPRVSLWQGSSDYTVGTANLGELTKQWTQVHGLTTTPTSSDTVATFPHQTWTDSTGAVVVETYSITGMSHGVAIDPTHGCGTAGTYFFDKGICSPKLMIDFFGITGGTVTPTVDAGTTSPSEDAGTVPPPVDAGTVTPPTTDAGWTSPPPVDAGTVTPPVDAGVVTPTVDSGVDSETVTPTTDAGVVAPTSVDGGTTSGPHDAGSAGAYDAGANSSHGDASTGTTSGDATGTGDKSKDEQFAGCSLRAPRDESSISVWSIAAAASLAVVRLRRRR